jgi:hypothetical protein
MSMVPRRCDSSESWRIVLKSGRPEESRFVFSNDDAELQELTATKPADLILELIYDGM